MELSAGRQNIDSDALQMPFRLTREAPTNTGLFTTLHCAALSQCLRHSRITKTAAELPMATFSIAALGR